MKPFIILGLLIIFPLLHSCGMFGGAEPEITKENKRKEGNDIGKKRCLKLYYILTLSVI